MVFLKLLPMQCSVLLNHFWTCGCYYTYFLPGVPCTIKSTSDAVQRLSGKSTAMVNITSTVCVTSM